MPLVHLFQLSRLAELRLITYTELRLESHSHIGSYKTKKRESEMKMIQQIMMGIGLTLVLTVSAMAQEQPLVRSVSSTRQADPLGSWNDGPTKAAILQFVQDVTKEGGPEFVPPEQRIATFDIDGTLWCEQPVIQVHFLMYRLKKMVEKEPPSRIASRLRPHLRTTKPIWKRKACPQSWNRSVPLTLE